MTRQIPSPSTVRRTLLLAAALLLPAVPAAAQFRPAVTYPTGLSPFSVVTADLNGDGIPDLAVPNSSDGGYGNGTVGVFLGKGDGTFAPQVDFDSGGQEPYSIAVADFNRDGHLDLAVSNYGAEGISGVTLLLGKGNGTFRRPVPLNTFPHPITVAAADLNHDGNPDLVVGIFGWTQILLGNGDGTFRAPISYGFDADDIAIADLNHDGNLDLAAADEIGGEVHIWLGNGDGTFQFPLTYPAGPGAETVSLADLDGDGALDLVVANAASKDNGSKGTTVSVLRGKGDGTFAARQVFPAGNQPLAAAVGDINHDGALDILVADGGGQFGPSQVVSLLLGDGTGNFGAPTPFTVGLQPAAVVLADLNRDHALDAAVANFGGNSLSILLNGVVPACTNAPKIVHLHAVPYQLTPADNQLEPVTVAYDVLSSCGGTPTCRIGISSNPATVPADRIVLDPHHIQLRAKPLPKAAKPLTYQVNVRCIDTGGNVTDAATPVSVFP